jgi:hypothetical protein
VWLGSVDSSWGWGGLTRHNRELLLPAVLEIVPLVGAVDCGGSIGFTAGDNVACTFEP